MRWPDICYFMLLIRFSSSELYSSIVGINKLLQTEVSTIQIFRSFVMKAEEQIEELKRQIELLQQKHIKSKEDPSNPLNSFILVKRLLVEWDNILASVLSQRLSQETEERLVELQRSDNYPTDEDLTGTVEGLNRISDTYNIDAASLANGVLNGIQYSTQLSADDCFEISKQSYQQGEHYHAYSWVNEALKRWHEEGRTEDKILEELLELKAYSAYELGYFSIAFNTTVELLKLFPLNTRATNNIEIFHASMIEENEIAESIITEINERILLEGDPYIKICRKEISPPVEITSKLKCRYINNEIPFLRLAPLKEEEAYLNPRIVLYRDVLYDSEIEIIKQMAIPKLYSALEQYGKDEIHVSSTRRIGQMAELADYEHPILRTINQRTEDITRLTASNAEPLQVVNYGVGGHYVPHSDYFEEELVAELEDGNRIATLLFYMNNVDQGGMTAFPYLNLSLRPEKGTAALWFNLLRDGRADNKTLHASCPVVAGTKWISTKWFAEIGQEFRRPCKKNMKM